MAWNTSTSQHKVNPQGSWCELKDQAIGMTVNVGFMRGLVVTDYRPTPGDYRPDVFVLQLGAKVYEFTPHFGISRVS